MALPRGRGPSTVPRGKSSLTSAHQSNAMSLNQAGLGKGMPWEETMRNAGNGVTGKLFLSVKRCLKGKQASSCLWLLLREHVSLGTTAAILRP